MVEILCCFCSVFLTLVQILFSIPAPCKLLSAVWEAGDMISFVGTITLGGIAISQTKKANEISERLMNLENNRYKLDIRPFVMVTGWRFYEIKIEEVYYYPEKFYIDIQRKNPDGNLLALELYLQNTTNSFLTIQYDEAICEGEKWGNSMANQPNNKLNLLHGESKAIVFYASREFFNELKGKKFILKFYLENRFSEKYKESFEFLITDFSGTVKYKEGELFCKAYSQNYRIEKLGEE